MFYHHREASDFHAVVSQVATVRLLERHEDLQAAVEGARDFERKGVAAVRTQSGPLRALPR